MSRVPASPPADEDNPTCRLQVPAASFSLSGLTIKAVLPPTSLREKKKKNDAPRLFPVIVSFISKQPDRHEPQPPHPFFFFSFFNMVPQMGWSICCLIKAPQPPGRPPPLAERHTAADPTSSLRRLFCTKDVAVCFLRAASKNKRHSSICRQ